MGNPLKGGTRESRTIGPLKVYRAKNWRTKADMLSIYYINEINNQETAGLEAGKVGGTVLTFNTGATRQFRDAVHEHRKQLDALLILWR